MNKILLILSFFLLGSKSIKDYSYVGVAGDTVVVSDGSKKEFVKIGSKIPNTDIKLLVTKRNHVVTNKGNIFTEESKSVSIDEHKTEEKDQDNDTLSDDKEEAERLFKEIAPKKEPEELSFHIADITSTSHPLLTKKIGDCIEVEGRKFKIIGFSYAASNNPRYQIYDTVINFTHESMKNFVESSKAAECDEKPDSEQSEEFLFAVGACLRFHQSDSEDRDVYEGDIIRIHGYIHAKDHSFYQYCVDKDVKSNAVPLESFDIMKCRRQSYKKVIEEKAHEVECTEDLDNW